MADILDPPAEELYIEDGKLRRTNKSKEVVKKNRDFWKNCFYILSEIISLWLVHILTLKILSKDE